MGWNQEYFGKLLDSSKQWLIRVLLISFSVFILLSVTVWTISSFRQKVVFVMFTLVLTFLMKPLGRSGCSRRFYMLMDTILILVSIVASVYLYVNDLNLVYRIGAVNPWDKIMAAAIIVLVLEATRRIAGWPLIIIAVVFVLYAFGGQFMPATLSHRGMSLERVLTELALTENGIYGVAVRTTIWFVFLFIIFGAFLEQAGTVKFFEEFSKLVAGKSVGGPAKVSVISSALMGMISGSAVANVVTTGAFTIPAMKRAGFKPPELVGAIEAAASTGGQLMPPVMGATAFVMAEFIGVPYVRIAQAALVPALLYFFSVGVAVHYQALKLGLKGAGDIKILPQKVIIKTYLFIPVVVLTAAMIIGYSATFSALFGLVTAICVGMFDRETRITFLRAAKALEEAARSSLSICAPVACAGIIAGITLGTGLGLKISSVVLHYSGGNVMVLLILSAVASIIFGMGLPSVVCYILLATLVGPALVAAGVNPLLGHLFLFYFGMLAMITPPVAFAAYAGAAIAGGNPMQTGWWAVKLTLPSFIIPFIWVYSPSLAGQGPLLWVVYVAITAALGVLAVEVAVLAPQQKFIIRLATLLSGVMLILPDHLTNVMGVVLLAAVWLLSGGRGKVQKYLLRVN